MADHAQTPVEEALPLAEALGERWRVLQPSQDRPEEAELAVSPTSRAAHVYLLSVDDPAAAHLELCAALSRMEGVELTCWLAGPDGAPLDRRTPGLPSDRITAVVERGDAALRFRPGA